MQLEWAFTILGFMIIGLIWAVLSLLLEVDRLKNKIELKRLGLWTPNTSIAMMGVISGFFPLLMKIFALKKKLGRR